MDLSLCLSRHPETSVIALGNCTLLETTCTNGCWFVYNQSGCKQASDCAHCHRELCCLAADLHRRELRKEHSRVRPSKKKRDKAANRVSPQIRHTSGWETSHQSNSFTEIEALIALIKGELPPFPVPST